MFERVAARIVPLESCLADPTVQVKQTIEVHKNVLMLRDNRASCAKIVGILQHSNILAQKLNKKIGDINELLLKHCHSFLSVPITFVPDHDFSILFLLYYFATHN